MRYEFVARAVLASCVAGIAAEVAGSQVVIPAVPQGAQRLVTVADMSALRKADTLTVSPDGKRYAIFVTQGDPAANDYRTGWFAGDTEGGPLKPLGEGGNVRFAQRPTGLVAGEIESREPRWSKDGEWIAYILRRNEELQLWRSNVSTGAQEQLTHNASDVRDYDWHDEGRLLYFTAGTPRKDLLSKENDRARRGYRYDEDLMTFTDLLLPGRRVPQEKDLDTWIVTLAPHEERRATDEERKSFEAVRLRNAGGLETAVGYAENMAVPPVTRPDGARAWLARSKTGSLYLRVVMQRSADAPAVECAARECLGRIERVWWSANGKKLFFWRHEGINDIAAHGFYSWSPPSGAVKRLLHVKEDLRSCAPASGDRVLCLRETKSQPTHVAAIDMTAGNIAVVADLNPEFRNIRLGRSEYIEWDTPKLAWNEPGGALQGLYPKRGYGFVLYPPDFDPKKKYPVFIDPYYAQGFNSSVGGEHALQVYAANGFVVLNLSLPYATDLGARLGANLTAEIYSEERDFPHLTMLMESTRLALQAVAARGFVDLTRVGIGGVSHGTFVPLYLMQKHDVITAISISSPHWGQHEYYWGTGVIERITRETYGAVGYKEWRPKPVGDGQRFWSKIDPAEHIDEIEGPVLMNVSADETYGLLRLIRHLRDAERPYDAYVFEKETHIKWQPAHLDHIMTRNLDWFRFWLQDIEDPDAAKEEQYTRWRKLRELQCRNPRSLRDYCKVVSSRSAPAR